MAREEPIIRCNWVNLEHESEEWGALLKMEEEGGRSVKGYIKGFFVSRKTKQESISPLWGDNNGDKNRLFPHYEDVSDWVPSDRPRVNSALILFKDNVGL